MHILHCKTQPTERQCCSHRASAVHLLKPDYTDATDTKADCSFRPEQKRLLPLTVRHCQADRTKLSHLCHSELLSGIYIYAHVSLAYTACIEVRLGPACSLCRWIIADGIDLDSLYLIYRCFHLMASHSLTLVPCSCP